MKKTVSFITAVAIVVIAVTCVFAFGYSMLNIDFSVAKNDADGSCEQDYVCAEDNVVFESLEEYLANVTAVGTAIDSEHELNAICELTNNYFVPETTLQDDELSCITVTGNSTVFDYQVNRGANVFPELSEDPIILAMLSLHREIEYYGENLYGSIITDHTAFAASLAQAIGAEPFFNNGQAPYYNDVRVETVDETGTVTYVAVGRQMVWINANGKTQYSYTPITVSKAEALALIGIDVAEYNLPND